MSSCVDFLVSNKAFPAVKTLVTLSPSKFLLYNKQWVHAAVLLKVVTIQESIPNYVCSWNLGKHRTFENNFSVKLDWIYSVYSEIIREVFKEII